MVNRIKEIFDKISSSKVKRKYIIIIGFVGVILILLSETIPSSIPKKEVDENYNSYIASLEKKTKNIISSVQGVGKCNVMITLDETNESFFAKNTEQDSDNSSFSLRNEYVLYEDNNNDSPILLKQSFPKIKGVVVVCQGGDNTYVKQQIISCIMSLYGISSNRITVTKMNR